MDSLWVRSPADTAMYGYGYLYANYASVTRSKFLNLYNYGFQFRGRKLVVDNSQFTGCAVVGTCGWNSGTAIYATADNDSGPAVTLTNSTFSKIQRALYGPSTNDSAGPYVVTNNTADSVSYFLDANADSTLISGNVLTKVQTYGFYTKPSGSNRPPQTAVLLNNRVICTGSGSYGIRVDNSPGRIEDNVTRDCYYGIYANAGTAASILNLSILRDSVGMPSVCCNYGIQINGRWRPTVYGSRVVGFYYGLYVYTTDTATVVIDSSAISAAGYMGLYLDGAGQASAMSGRRNRIANNGTYGIYNAYHLTGTRSFTDGAITGNGTSGNYGIYNGAPGTFIATDNW